jgi:hypothetical protein
MGPSAGSFALKVLGIIGGILAIVVGVIWLGFGFIASTSVHVGSSGGMMAMAGAVGFILIGLLAIYGSIIYTKKPKLASRLLIVSGVIGFPVGFILDLPLMGGAWGLISWAIPGTLIIIAGLISWMNTRGLISRLPLLSDGRAEVRLGGQMLYGALAVVGIALLMGILTLGSLILFYSILEQVKTEDDYFSDVMRSESMGQYDTAIDQLDQIIAKNQSNAEAWRMKGQALEKIGRYNEAEKSYQRALQLEPANS